ncbi:radical SAM family heme chaperone HemW [Bavariicoccus seileri]|uniref:radical SAM family heme chaperone HemW n=1 Tax=Bavariicoccus seileri TaxID=549685 RepID=UPI003F8EBD38
MTSAYIHIPFCEQICYYCDFNKVFIEGQPVDDYVNLLIEEFRLWNERGTILPLKSIYIGGGTPSALSVKQFEVLFDGIRNYLPLRKGGEFTIECNPNNATNDLLTCFKRNNVNRLSFGVQSFNDDLLKKIGRIHRSDTVYKAINLAEQIGFHNISIDLIYRLPNQTLEDFQDSLTKALELDLPHYAIYSLILEQKTVFYNLMRQGKLPLPSEDIEADMFEMAIESMENAGKQHYEISNFAQAGFQSTHNKAYWNGEDYYGFGAGAHGLLDGTRYQNLGPINHYMEPLQKHELPIFNTLPLSQKMKIEEFFFLGLRQMEGVSISLFEKKFGQSIGELYGDEISQLLEKDLITLDGDHLALTRRGIFLGNDVFSEFMLLDR